MVVIKSPAGYQQCPARDLEEQTEGLRFDLDEPATTR